MLLDYIIKGIKQVAVIILTLPIRAYQILISPFFPGTCRFYPTCSAYCLEAIKKHGPFKGIYLCFMRLSRCHPWGGHGIDPVP